MKTLKEKYYVYGIICIYIIIFAVFHKFINSHFPISLDNCSELTKMIVEALPPVAIGSATYLVKLISIIFALKGIADPGKQEFFIIREFDAPRELVFRAFSTVDLLEQFRNSTDLATSWADPSVS